MLLQHCIGIQGNELKNISEIIHRINELKPESYDVYHNDVKYICDLFESMMRKETIL